MSFNKNIYNHELEIIKDVGYCSVYCCKKCDYYIVYYRSTNDYYITSAQNWLIRTTPWLILNLNCEDIIIKNILE